MTDFLVKASTVNRKIRKDFDALQSANDRRLYLDFLAKTIKELRDQPTEEKTEV
jgi:hypothetical protein